MLDRLIDAILHSILWAGILLGILMVTSMFTGCVMSDPSQWRPDQHMLMSRNCRVVCQPGMVREYSSMDGSCSCQRRK